MPKGFKICDSCGESNLAFAKACKCGAKFTPKKKNKKPPNEGHIRL